MTSSMRKEFENFVKVTQEFGDYASNFYRDTITDEYTCLTVQLAWEAWKQARATPVVVLPIVPFDPYADDVSRAHAAGRLSAVDEIKKSLIDQGVKFI